MNASLVRLAGVVCLSMVGCQTVSRGHCSLTALHAQSRLARIFKVYGYEWSTQGVEDILNTKLTNSFPVYLICT